MSHPKSRQSSQSSEAVRKRTIWESPSCQSPPQYFSCCLCCCYSRHFHIRPPRRGHASTPQNDKYP
ncbi:hypothetical protein BJV78DRAFT_33812 [Lactifluus subvellereus]|nr:hypothetical protein BJV78DRAFT_33812 [Lactifluus subvellereus]